MADKYASAFVSGIAGTLVSHPLDLVRTQQAVYQGQSIRATLVGLVSRGGPKALYRGLWPPLAAEAVYRCTCLGTTTYLVEFRRRILEQQQRAAGGSGANVVVPMMDVALCSTAGGMVSCLFCAPADLVKTRAMVKEAGPGAESVGLRAIRSNIEVLRQCNRKEAFRSIRITMVRDIYSTAGFFCTYEVLVRELKERTGMSRMGCSIGAGMVAGPIGWMLCYPIEVYRIQWQTKQLEAHTGGLLTTVKDITAKEGYRFWFRGCGTCCMRSAVQIPTCMLTFEALQAFLAKHRS